MPWISRFVICANPLCGREFVRPARSNRKCCTQSCAISWSWQNPKTKALRSAGIKEQCKTPAAIERNRRHNERRWSKPGERERLSEWNRRRWADPVIKACLSAKIAADHRRPEARAASSAQMKKNWRDPIIRSRTIENATKSQRMQAYRAHFSEILRARWADPVWRKKYSDGIRWYMNQPEVRMRFSMAMKKRWDDPVQRAKMLAAHSARMLQLWADPEFHDRMIVKLADARRIAQEKRRIPTGIISAEDAIDATMAVILDAEGGKRRV